MVMAKYFTSEWSGYNDKTDETYILEYWFQKNKLPIMRHNPLLFHMLPVASFNCR